MSLPPHFSLATQSRFGSAITAATIKQSPEDFVVTELAQTEATGSGEHLWLKITKTNANTQWIAKQLADWAEVPLHAVGYAGLKDRAAVTTQNFTIHTPKDADSALEQLSNEFTIDFVSRHARKLRVGELLGNQFQIRLRNIDITKQNEIGLQLQQIKDTGVPNYFGMQRFGIDGNNMLQAWSRTNRKAATASGGIYLSAVRSYLFNQLLSLRVKEGNWNSVLTGDLVWSSSDTRGKVVQSDDLIAADWRATGPLWGKGRLLTQADAAGYEQQIANENPEWVNWIVKTATPPSRRLLQLQPQNMHWQWQQEPAVLDLVFELPAGSYATVVLQQIFDFYA